MRLFILLILLDLDGDCEQRSNLFEGVEEEIMEIEEDMSVTELCALLLCTVAFDEQWEKNIERRDSTHNVCKWH